MNQSDCIANQNCILSCGGSSEPKKEEHKEPRSPTQEPDFFSATFSDLKELANDLFMGGSSHNTSRRRTNDRSTSAGLAKVAERHAGAESPFIRMEDATSTTVPVPEHRPEIHEAPPSTVHDATGELMTSAEREAKEQEQIILESFKEFLSSGNGRSIHSFLGANGARIFEFRGDGETRKISIGGTGGDVLFDQGDYHRRPSSSQASQATSVEPVRCLTPETAEGDDDFEMLI